MKILDLIERNAVPQPWAEGDKRTGENPRSRVVAQLGQQSATRSLLAALRELAVRDTNLAIPDCPPKASETSQLFAPQAATRS